MIKGVHKQMRGAGFGSVHKARCVLPIVTLLVAMTANAQQSIVDLCRKTSSDADRIACLEAALLGKAAPQTVAGSSAAAVITEPGDSEPDAGGKTSTEITAEVPAPTPKTTRMPDDSPADVSNVPVGIGAEQVIARSSAVKDRDKSRDEARGLVVKGYNVVPYERLQVTLENGQVWRQIKGDTQRIRVSLRRNQTVDISESAMSGYKLRLNEMQRTIRVERIR